MADEEFDHWDEVAAEIDGKVNQLVRATVFKAQAIAQQESRVDTSFMKNAWYTRTEDSSNRQTPTPPQDAFLFPEVSATPHNEAWIIGGASYTIYNEFGTVHMAAKPMAAPAIEQVRQPFLKALEAISNGSNA